jgi:hypothetical protein
MVLLVFCVSSFWVLLEQAFIHVHTYSLLHVMCSENGGDYVGVCLLQLIIMDAENGNLTQIPSLRSSDDSVAAECPCGIHAISINPSRSLLATGATNTNDLAVYKLPTFDPVCTGEVISLNTNSAYHLIA